jgi:hypothetical protein
MIPETFDDSPGYVSFDRALQRAKADFLEMPGLRLTAAQARRLWMLDDGTCEAVLSSLVRDHFLAPSGTSFVRAATSMQRL